MSRVVIALLISGICLLPDGRALAARTAYGAVAKPKGYHSLKVPRISKTPVTPRSPKAPKIPRVPKVSEAGPPRPDMSIAALHAVAP